MHYLSLWQPQQKNKQEKPIKPPIPIAIIYGVLKSSYELLGYAAFESDEL